MPFHQTIALRLKLLEDIPSMAAAFADPEFRSALEAFDSYPDATPPPSVATEDRTVPGPHGPVPVRIYRPHGQVLALRPGFVWVHGGAFRFGDLDMREADWTARDVAAKAGAVVISVDYRLAVDGITYPVPLDDVVSSIRWVRAHSAELGIGGVSVGGASAGANLAAGAALRLRDEDGWVPRQLILVYAILHGTLPLPSDSLAKSQQEMLPVMRLTADMTGGMVKNYLGEEWSTPPDYAMPGSANLAGLGPTLVLNAEYDDLRASGEAFSASLAAAGVDIQQVMVKGLLHGFLNLSRDFAPVGTALDLMAQQLRTESFGV
jgi:acetyl esterase/lipase